MSFVPSPPLKHYELGQSEAVKDLAERELGPLTRFCRQAALTKGRISFPGADQDHKNFQKLFLGRLKELHTFLDTTNSQTRKEYIQNTELDEVDFGSRWVNFWVHYLPCFCSYSWIAKKVKKVANELLATIGQYQREAEHQNQAIVQETMNAMLTSIEDETQIRQGFEQDPECAQLLQQLPDESSFAEIYGEALRFFKQETLSVELFKDYLEFAIETIRCKSHGTQGEISDRFKYVQTRRAFLKDFASNPLMEELRVKLTKTETGWDLKSLLEQAYYLTALKERNPSKSLFQEYVSAIIQIIDNEENKQFDADFIEGQRSKMFEEYVDGFKQTVVPRDQEIQSILNACSGRTAVLKVAFEYTYEHRLRFSTRTQFREQFLFHLKMADQEFVMGNTAEHLKQKMFRAIQKEMYQRLERKASEPSQRSNSGSGREE